MEEVRLYIGVDEIDIRHISEKYNGSIYTIFEFITDNPDDVSDADRRTLYEVYNGEINDPRSEFSEEEYDIYDEEHEVEYEMNILKMMFVVMENLMINGIYVGKRAKEKNLKKK